MANTAGKQKRGVLVTVERQGERLTLHLDDLEQSVTDKGTWNQRDHVTHKDVSLKDFQAMTLNDRELIGLAEYVLARLNAYVEVGES
jgi:hypothetical protein